MTAPIDLPNDLTNTEPLLTAAKAALIEQPRLFRSRGKLVEVVADGDRRFLRELRWGRVSALLATSRSFQVHLKRTKTTSPAWLPTHLLQSETWPELRSIAGITDVPVLRPDGSLLTTPGYDAQMGLWYEPSITIPALPPEPTRDDATAALKELSEILDLFPVMSAAHRSAMVAAMLTPFAVTEGDAPLFLFDSPNDACGASEGADLVGLLATGRRMVRMERAVGDRAFRRQVARLPPPASGVVLLDGANEFRSATALKSALQELEWVDGLAGNERRPRLNWYAVTTNSVLSREAAELVLPIRMLDSLDGSLGTIFEQPTGTQRDLRARRPQLVRAALTILRAYVVAGRPRQETLGWPRFREWSDLVAQAIVWAGGTDPLIARRTNRSAIGDDESAGLRNVVLELAMVLPQEVGHTTAMLVEMMREGGPAQGCRLAFCRALGTTELTARNVGNFLRAHRDRSVEGLFIHRAGTSRSGYARWIVDRHPLVPCAAKVPRQPKEWDLASKTVQFSDGGLTTTVDAPNAPIERVGDYEVHPSPPKELPAVFRRPVVTQCESQCVPGPLPTGRGSDCTEENCVEPRTVVSGPSTDPDDDSDDSAGLDFTDPGPSPGAAC